MPLPPPVTTQIRPPTLLSAVAKTIGLGTNFTRATNTANHDATKATHGLGHSYATINRASASAPLRIEGSWFRQ
eukprot:2522240-Amphidinium_carterae.1